jgi:folate-dependent phosphoribosylglycinamide formyltransferase PurN
MGERKLELVYEPKPGRKMRVVVLFSGGASALKYLLENDPNLGQNYEIVGAFTDREDASGIELAQRAGIPVEIFSFKKFLEEHRAERTDPKARQAYFTEVLKRIGRWHPDILILSGFMLIVTEPLLSAFKHRILNVHPADLRVRDERGRRKYVGMDVVARAIRAGEKFTRSTIHLVTEEVDGGPILVVSDPLEVEPGVSPEEHQERMKWACDGPAYQKALELITEGRVWVDERAGCIKLDAHL